MKAIGIGTSYIFNNSITVRESRELCQLYITYAKSLNATIYSKSAICKIYNTF